MSIFGLLAKRQQVAEQKKFSKLDDLARYVSSLSESAQDDESEAETVEAGLKAVGATREMLEARVRQLEKRQGFRQTLANAATAQGEIDRRDTEWRQIDAEQQEALLGFQLRRDVLSNGIDALRSVVASADQARRELLEGCQDHVLLTREKHLLEERQQLAPAARQLENTIAHQDDVIRHNERAAEDNSNPHLVAENATVLATQKQTRDGLYERNVGIQSRLREINVELDSIRDRKLTSDF